jgi:putative chromate ion transporter
MQRDLVEERRWISRQDYLDGLALAQLAPGPLAAQLAMYLGYVRGGMLGATIVAVCFVLPSFLMVWALSVAYVRFGGLPWMQALFYGVGAAVIVMNRPSDARLGKSCPPAQRAAGDDPMRGRGERALASAVRGGERRERPSGERAKSLPKSDPSE